MRPVMVVIAGPPGSGKSTAFPVRESGVDYFNSDDVAAALNQSYKQIPAYVRAEANRRFEAFVLDHIAERVSFAIETTLRSASTFDQGRMAHRNGFIIDFRFLALESVEKNIERVMARAYRGGHSVSPGRLRQIHAASLRNFVRALREFDRIRAYDNTAVGRTPRLVLEVEQGQVRYFGSRPPAWLTEALQDTEFALTC
jgi:predicted ABC-type ATPase